MSPGLAPSHWVGFQITISDGLKLSTNQITLKLISVIFVALIIPATFMIDQFSVRLMVLIGCGFNLAGAFVKLFAFKSNLFPILFIGQVLSQVTWSVINQIGGKLANQWCPESEISLATGWKLKKAFS